MGRRKRRANNNSGKGIILILIIVVLVLVAIFAVKFLSNKKDGENTILVGKKQEEVVVKKLKIVDEDSKSRPYAVMINNNHAAWPQCGIQDAYLVYEIIAEGRNN